MTFSGDQLLTLATVRENNFVLDNDALYEIMQWPQIKDGTRPLVIISIAGAFRSGKSFVLNFLLRYLRNRGWENPDWFGDDGTSLAGDFPWKRGSDACTKEINVCREVFSVPTTDGREAVVILVDTQGLFDDDTSPDINAKMMSLSTLFCSHQILNLMRHIEERDLEHLELCIAFAKAAANIERRGDAKPFQKLTFLVRDWEREDECGDSTDGYLRKYFSKKSKSPEVQKVKTSISGAFDSLACTLLPHPGKKVVKPEDQVPTNRDLDGEFKDYVMKFVTSVLGPRNLVIKRGNDGKEQTMSGLGNLLGTVGNAFKAGKIPTAKTLLQSVVKGNNKNAMIQAARTYKHVMREVCQGIMDAETLSSAHQNSWQQAVEHFQSLANMGDEESKVEFLRQLEKECNDDFASVERANENRKLQEERQETLDNEGMSASNMQVRKAKALFEYEPVEDDELALKIGDIIIDVKDAIDVGWCEGLLNGKRGMFPGNYVEMLKEEEEKKIPAPPAAHKKQSKKEFLQITDDIFMDKEKPLKEGAKIYKGYQEHVGGQKLPLAIKVIVPCTQKSIREVEHLISLAAHPNVVRIVSSKEHNDRLPTLYIAMELCSSQNLQDYLNENRKKNIPFDFKKAMLYSEGLILGIKHIHRKRIIHGDLKPANILFSLDGDQIKISDFGISKLLQQSKFVAQITSQGTDGYRAPETYNSDLISLKADIYSLGVTLYSIWTNGKHPFGEDLYLRVVNITRNTGRDFSCLPEEMGAKKDEFLKLLKKMLKFDPKRRPTIEEISEHPFFNSRQSTTAQEMCSHTNVTNITNYNVTGAGSTVVTAPVGQLAAGNANITNQGARNNFVAGLQENTDRSVTAGKAIYGQSTSLSVGENITVHRTGK